MMAKVGNDTLTKKLLCYYQKYIYGGYLTLLKGTMDYAHISKSVLYARTLRAETVK